MLPKRWETPNIEYLNHDTYTDIITFDNSEEELMSKYMLKGWKKSKIVTNETARNYFRHYKDLTERMLSHRNDPAVKIQQNGQTFYWLNEYFMPTMQPTEQPEYTKH